MTIVQSSPAKTLIAVSLCLSAAAATATDTKVTADRDTVGEVSMAIGVVRAISFDGASRVLARGKAVRVGDKIETTEGGHVHIRFIDGALLSVRPLSRLVIENYTRPTDQPALTAIKFRLDEGVVRSITGAWGEAARDRFRLNTPVAAIGIKGTDFAVKTDVNNTFASVYTGAIMLTPLASGCQTSFGPCQNGSEKLLTEDMKGQMLALSRLQVIPQLVPSVDLLAQRARPLTSEYVAKSDQSLKTDASRPDVTNEKTLAGESRAVDVVAIGNSSAVIPPLPPVVVIEPPKPVLPPEVRQLAWARLAVVAADSDTISRSFAAVKQNGWQGTVGNVAFSLYRENPSVGPAVLSSSDTSANFRLAGATAQLTRLDRGIETVEAAQVGGGTLNVNFARSTFATQLSVSSVRTGVESVISNGIITPTGIFQTQGGNAFTSGALSFDGKEAGYFFAKPVASGELTGITQWGR